MIRTLLLMMAIGLMTAGCMSQSISRPESAGPPSEMLQRHLDLGVGYLRNRDYRRAKDKLNRALAIDPKNAQVHATFGMLFQLEGETELAEKYFKNAVKFDPESAQSRNSYGAFLFSEKRYDEAVKQLEKASENRFYQHRPTVFENLGVAYTKLGDPVAAEYAYARAVQLNPDQPRALIELSEIRFNEQNYVEARQLYMRHEKVASRTPKTLWLCVRLARIFKNQNDEASCSVALEGLFPATEEYKLYKESL